MLNAPELRWPPSSLPACHFIDNRFVAAADGATLPMTDPPDGTAFASIARGGAADIAAAVEAAQRSRDGVWGRFSPVQRGRALASMPFDDEADALRLANATGYGLVAGVWTRDGGRGLRMARGVRSGRVFVNSYGGGGGVERPFGGVKHSGYGREKGFEAPYGLTTLKTVVLCHG